MLRVVVTLLLLVTTLSSHAAERPVATNFTLKSLAGENVRLSEYRGSVVMINFWASWCGPCRQELPVLDRLFQRYQRAGFVILAVNVEEDNQKAKNWVQELGLSFPVLFDNGQSVTDGYDVKAMPSSVIIDRDGAIAYRHDGYKPGDEAVYQKKVAELIRE